MARGLFLAHRIPYPPNKGDKIRSWHILEHLASNHEIHLACFVDNAEDARYGEVLERVCASVHTLERPRWLQKGRALTGLFSGRSLTVAAYQSRLLRGAIERMHRHKAFDFAYIYSGAMAQFMRPYFGSIPSLVDLVDVDSAKWAEYAVNSSWPLAALYKYEAKRLHNVEMSAFQQSAKTFFVSAQEASLFRSHAAEDGAGKRELERILPLANGIDFQRFYPRTQTKPLAGPPVILFTGAMDYIPNIEAVLWFAEEIFPLIQARHPDILFRIAGGPMAAAVKRLAEQKGISLSESVPDMSDEIAGATLSIAPLKTARGVQNKVLEAMAMAKPVIATSKANEGIEARPGEAILIADDAAMYAEHICGLLDNVDAARALGENGFRHVRENFQWQGVFDQLDGYLDEILTPGYQT